MSNNKSVSVELQGLDNLKRQLGQMISAYSHMEPLFHEISGIMDYEVEENFQAGGRDPQWPESQRVKKHGGQTLIDSAQLVGSIQEFITGNSAGVSTNKPYAAIHNFGGDIVRKPFSGSVRLRTNAKGDLLRQDGHANLAVFAKGRHKRAVTRDFSSDGFTIHMPQREFMKISSQGMANIELAAARFITGT